MPRRNRVAANFYASLKRNSSNAGGNQGPSPSKVNLKRQLVNDGSYIIRGDVGGKESKVN